MIINQGNGVVNTVDGTVIDINKYLPIGVEYRHIDSAQLLSDSRIVCTYDFKGDRDYQRAHFSQPGKILMAGALELEGLLQAAIILFGATQHPDDWSGTKGFRAKKAAIEWFWPVTKNKTIRYEVSVTDRERTEKDGIIWHFQGDIHVGKHLVAKAIFSGTIGK